MSRKIRPLHHFLSLLHFRAMKNEGMDLNGWFSLRANAWTKPNGWKGIRKIANTVDYTLVSTDRRRRLFGVLFWSFLFRGVLQTVGVPHGWVFLTFYFRRHCRFHLSKHVPKPFGPALLSTSTGCWFLVLWHQI